MCIISCLWPHCKNVPTVVATISTNDVDYRQWTALTLSTRVLVSVFPRCWGRQFLIILTFIVKELELYKDVGLTLLQLQALECKNLVINDIISFSRKTQTINNQNIMNEISIKILKGEFGYNREETINILTNLNPDGSEFKQLPF